MSERPILNIAKAEELLELVRAMGSLAAALRALRDDYRGSDLPGLAHLMMVKHGQRRKSVITWISKAVEELDHTGQGALVKKHLEELIPK